MQVAKRVGTRGRQQTVLNLLEFFSHELQDREIIIDHRIHQGVQQVVGARGSKTALAGAQTVAKRRPHVGAVFLERQQKALAHHDTDLFGQHASARGVETQHLEDKIDDIAIVFALRTLLGIDDVFEQ